MIQKVTLSNIASYKDSPAIIEDLTKINFIYGTNGTGKTTISNVLNSPSSFPTCAIEWKDNRQLDVVTYNKEFKDSHFVQNIPGVFTLGAAAKEDFEELDRLNKELASITKQGIAERKTLSEKEESLKKKRETFEEWCWSEIKVKFELAFKEVMQGSLNSKSKFAQRVLDEIDKKYERETYAIEELTKRANVFLGETPQPLTPIPSVNFDRIRDIEQDGIWRKKIIGKEDIDISHYIAKLNIYDWVNQGRRMIIPESDICPFCQKHTIDEDFVSKLNRMFDEQYSADNECVNRLYVEYQKCSEIVLSQLRNIRDGEKINSNTQVDVNKLSDSIILLEASLLNCTHLMEEKIHEPSRSIDIPTSANLLDSLSDIIKAANDLISEYNRRVENISSEKKKIGEDFWHYIQKFYSSIFLSYNTDIRDIGKAISSLKTKLEQQRASYSEVKGKIEACNRKVTSIQSSIDAINKMLVLYGFTNFSIVPSNDNQYQIQRDSGEIANTTLSEGEINFITFLYFMQLVYGGKTAEEACTERVVVIDDPISSLDSMVLYVVSSIIKDLKDHILKGCYVKQLIVLTHNIFFHKEISFIDGREQQNQNYSFWVVNKRNGESYIKPHYHMNPIKSSYEMLWDEIKNWRETSAASLQNTMRRIYETYFKIFGKLSDNQILASIQDIEEKRICLSLIGWINDGSHTIPDDYFLVPSDDEKEKYFEVFRLIFDKMHHIEHYNMMMGIRNIEIL